MEEFILNLLEDVGNLDFTVIWQVFYYGLIVFWIVVLYWVWLDSGDRTSNIIVRLSYVLLVAVLNIIGLLIYLIIRPGQTIEEIYWADLERRYLKYETAELGDCPRCGRQLFPGYTFCPNCRYKLKRRCVKCEVFISKKDKFCPHCGQVSKKKRSPEETSPSKEVMEEQIEATKKEAKDVVRSKKTRYSRASGFVVRIGESVIGGYKIIYSKIKGLFAKKPSKLKEGEKNQGESKNKTIKHQKNKKESKITNRKEKKKQGPYDKGNEKKKFSGKNEENRSDRKESQDRKDKKREGNQNQG